MGRIVAVVGMCGSGKSVACDYFTKLGYKIVYFGGVTLDLMKEQNIEITPDNEKNMRESLRKEHGMGAYAKILLPKIKELSKDNDVCLDGLYSWSELTILNKEFDNIIVISLVCDKHLRYDRLSKREVRPLTMAEANKRDIAEIENLEKGGPISYADYYIFNNGTKEDIEKRIDDILNNI